MIFEIRNRWTLAVQFSCELSADMAGSYYGSKLGFAVKKALDERGADLGGADLRGANLRGANLRGAVLRDSDLRDSVLRDSDLRDSVLRDSDLRGADLRGANLRGAVLRDADLGDVKQDFLAAVLRLPNELEALRDALVSGKVDGSTYSGDCPCLAGTLAKARGIERYQGDHIKNGVVTFTADARSPRERFFTAIRRGDTPETNPAAEIALEWTNEAIAIRDMIRATAPGYR
jgi:hypothetical protein